VNTNTTFFQPRHPADDYEVLNYLNDDLASTKWQISPAYAYEKAPPMEHFLGVEETRDCSARRSRTGGAKWAG